MDIDPDIAESRPAVLLASALHLLTCSAAHGVSRAKCESLVQHLSALADKPDTDPLLAKACDELADVWSRLAQELQQSQSRNQAAAQAVPGGATLH